MPRILIVSPHFPPVNAPDMQRVRMSLPHFVDAGWEIVVLTVDDRQPLAPLEPELLHSVPAAVRVVRAHAWSRTWTRWLGMNNLGLRTLPFLYLAGRRLIAEQPFDVIYFSTTQFILLPLGRLWHGEFGVPYVIDLQDPWLSDYYSRPGAPRPPGGWKYRFAHASARLLEGWTLARVAHIISVSEAYLITLARRYPRFAPDTGSVLTFGAPDRDFALARDKHRHEPPLLPGPGRLRIAYAGRLGPDMLPALAVLFAAVARHRETGPQIELFFYGTSYAPAGTGAATTAALAARHGIADRVHEFPARIGYVDSLRLLVETDLALVLGSEDRAYSPSKLYPTLLAGKPTLAIAPRDSVLAAKVAELGGAVLVRFGDGSPDASAVTELSGHLRNFAQDAASWPADPANLELVTQNYTAAAVANAQLEIFATVISRQRPPDPTLSGADPWTSASVDLGS